MQTRALTAVSELTDALSRARTLDDVYSAALDALQRSLGVDRSSILLFDEKAFMGFVAWRGISDAYRAAVNGHTPWTPDTVNPEPVLISDAEAVPDLAKYLPVFRAENIRALGFFPLNYRDHVIGKFMLYYAAPHQFTTDEIDLAKTVAGQIAFGVARVRAEQALADERTRLVEMVAHVPGMVWETMGEPGNQPVTFVSDGIRELTGYDAHEWYGDPRFWYDRLVDFDSKTFGSHMRSAAADGSTQVHEFRVRRRDGRIVWLQARSTHRYEGDKIINRGVTVDVTAQKFLNEASAVLASSLDYESTLPRVAALAVEYLGAGCVIEVDDRIFKAGQAAGRSVREPLTAGGRVIGALELFREDHETAAELASRVAYAVDNARLYREAQNANRAKDEFLATLSHELRTPITATLGWASMLRMGIVSPENMKLAVDAIERSTRAQAKLIDDILDVSRIVAGKFQLNLGPVHLPSIVQAAADAIRPNIEANNLRLDLNIEPIHGVPTGDAGRLQQVIWNLLSNSVKFTPPGGAIAVSVAQRGANEVTIAVSDTGCGIPKSFLPFLFERYRQADSSPSRPHGGLGLGLAIVKSIVGLHSGSVSVASEGEGKGTTFTITLPLVNAVGIAAAPSTQQQQGLSLRGVSVLVVEDDAATRGMLSAVLASYGADVRAADSARAAVEQLAKSRPNVILSDIAMPGEDGCQFLMRIRSGAVERCADVPAIAITAYAAPEDRDRILSSGFRFHLSKPVDPLTVVQTVRQALES
ncbi:MAG TPA: ATP-binding protein [Thermoanaerobaculia bacterium]|nr:ATP-binding protein [Thermoanaerobaculia bacterium]